MILTPDDTVIVIFGDNFQARAIERLLHQGPKDKGAGGERYQMLLRTRAEATDWTEHFGKVKKWLDERQNYKPTLLLIGDVPARFESWLLASKKAWQDLDIKRLGPSQERDDADAATMLEQVEDLTVGNFGGTERERIVALAEGGIAGLARQVWRERHRSNPPTRRKPAGPRRAFPKDTIGVEDGGVAPDDEEAQSEAPSAKERDRLREFGDRVIAAYLELTDPKADRSDKSKEIDALVPDGQRFKVRRIRTGRTAPKKASGWSPPELLFVLASNLNQELLPLALYRHAEDFGSPWTHALDWVIAWRAEEPAEPPTLIGLDIQVQGGGRRKALLELVGRHHAKALRAAGMETVVEQAGAQIRLKIRARLPVHDNEIAKPSPRRSECLSALLDAVLDELLLLNRPLRAWSSGFFVPFAIDDEARFRELRGRAIDAALAGANGVELVAFDEDDEQRLYFGVDSQDVITPTFDDIETCRKRLEDGGEVNLDRRLLAVDLPIKGLTFSLEKHLFQQPKRLPFKGLRLYFFYAECAALEWCFDGEDPAEERILRQPDQAERERPPAYWPRLLLDDVNGLATLGDLLDVNQAARTIYGAFKAEEDEADQLETLQTLIVGDRVRGRLLLGSAPSANEIEGWFEVLLQHAFAKIDAAAVRPRETCKLLIDERARVITSAVPWGDMPKTEAGKARFERLLTRLQTVERMGDGCAYDEVQALADLKDGYYRRFASYGSHYLISEQGFAFLGFGDYARTPIHERHMAGVYLRMARLTQFYVAILRALRRRLAEALEGWPPKSGPVRLPDDYQRIERRMLAFNNLLWFTQPSSQIQATELFDMLLETSRAERERALLTEETERTGNHVEDAIERRGDRLIRTLALFGAPPALFLGLMALRGLAEPPAGSAGDQPAAFAWGWLSLAQIGHSLDCLLGGTSLFAEPWRVALLLSVLLAAGLYLLVNDRWSPGPRSAGLMAATLTFLAMPAWTPWARFSAAIAIFLTTALAITWPGWRRYWRRLTQWIC